MTLVPHLSLYVKQFAITATSFLPHHLKSFCHIHPLNFLCCSPFKFFATVLFQFLPPHIKTKKHLDPQIFHFHTSLATRIQNIIQNTCKAKNYQILSKKNNQWQSWQVNLQTCHWHSNTINVAGLLLLDISGNLISSSLTFHEYIKRGKWIFF